MFKKTIAIILIFAISFLLIGCKDDPVNEKVPDTPKNVVILDGNVSWDSVSNATGYLVFVNNKKYPVETTNFNLIEINLAVGRHEVYIKAVNGKIESVENSLSVYYTVESTSIEGEVPDAPKNLAVSDDAVSWESAKHATGYLVFVNEEEYFVDSTTFSLKGFYLEDGVYSIYVKSVKDKTESKEASETVKYTVDRTLAREEVYKKLLKFSNEKFVPNMTEEDFDDEWWEYEYYQQAVKANGKLSITLTAAGLGVDELATIEETIENIEALNMDQKGSMVLLKAEIDKFRNMGITANQLAYVLYSYATLMIEMQIDENLEYLEPEDLEMLTSMQELLVDEKQAFISGILSTVNFMYDLYDGVQATMLNSIENIMQNEEFNVTEFVILKNEIVAMLTTTMPTVQDFENMYSISGMISGEFLGLEKTDWDSLVQGSAIMSRNAMTIELLLLASIDVTTVNEIKEIVDQINEAEMFEYGLLLDLGEYFINYIDEFFVQNQAVIDALPELNQEAIKAEIYIILEKVVLKVMELELYEEDYTYYSTYVERFFNNIADFEAALDLIVENGEDELRYFIEKQGIILEFFLTGYYPEIELITGAEIIEYFNQLLELNKLIVGQHQKSDIETILNGLKIPMELFFKEALELDRAFDASVEINVMLPYMATVLSNVIVLESELFAYIDDHNIIEAINAIKDLSEIEDINNEEKIQIAEILITNLSLFFTEERENMIIETITIMMDNIMSRDIILDNTGITIVEIAEEKTNLINEFNLIIEELDRLAAFDFNNLTLEQEVEILEMFQSFSKEEVY